jgi:hypothetical protein
VYPERNLKEEYINRYKKRGSPQGFIDLISSNWDSFLDELDNQQGCNKLILKQEQFLADVLDSLVVSDKNNLNQTNENRLTL